jgi:ABC-type Mn2+/Zn2+ transport system ATPase subunit
MDEPFTGLDAPSEALLESLIDRLAGNGKTIMIATHEVEQVSRWDLVLCLNKTQISFGSPADALSRPVLEATYGGHIVEIPGQPELGVLPAHHHHHDETAEGS